MPSTDRECGAGDERARRGDERPGRRAPRR